MSNPTSTDDPQPTATDGQGDAKAAAKPPLKPRYSRRRSSGLHPPFNRPGPRSRSHSRFSTVTDKGQVQPSTEDLTKISSLAPPPDAGLAEATIIAPERRASPLPSPRSEFSNPVTPGITIHDTEGKEIGNSRPQSPQTPTLIPSTDGSSTRPTRGGIAYPFSLRVRGEGRDVNASMVTLQSVNENVPSSPISASAAPAAVAGGEAGEGKDKVVNGEGEKEPEVGEQERPGIERFETAADTYLTYNSNGKNDAKENGAGIETAERPGVERFETAQEDLSTLANGEHRKSDASVRSYTAW